MICGIAGRTGAPCYIRNKKNGCCNQRATVPFHSRGASIFPGRLFGRFFGLGAIVTCVENEMVTAQATAAALGLRGPWDGEWLQITPGERLRIHVSARQTMGAFSMVELIADPGAGVPMHVHDNEDEHFIVLEGALHMAVCTRRQDLVAGDSLTVPRGVAHAWCNASKAPVHVLAVFSPAGIEELFGEIAGVRDAVEIAAIARRHGTRMIGPPLSEAAYAINMPER
jgi:quercetin dioxygenase-like cupin family protein